LSRLREVFDCLRSRLVTFRDEQGRELFDLPEAPRPDPATPAPPRFLYDYDNLLLSHADRGRFITDDYSQQGFTADGEMPSIVLVDGVTSGTWKVTRRQGVVTLTIKPFSRFAGADAAAIGEEGARLLECFAPDAKAYEIEIVPARVETERQGA
jgi:hypothetical protein